ncbi:hypothetical protein [Bremerella sp.]|uniref:hypothetical protein n=1 Tax=Bremerella sp. TaxID=2795602 RepID=UPI00391A85E6
MNGDAPEFIEATRLTLKFFPEALDYISIETGLDWEAFLSAMMQADYGADFSCDPYRRDTDPDLGLARLGAIDGTDREVYERLLKHSGLTTAGRAVVVPDAIGRDCSSSDECLPLVCHSARVPERLAEVPCFGGGRNTMIVFENGTALLIDHNDHVHWAKSRRRNDG